MKKKLGVVVGRFQPLHKGHEKIINYALKKCKRVAVFIGSAQEENTERNPFSYEVRKHMLRMIYGNRIEIYPLYDLGVGENTKWGDYLLKTITNTCGRPDAMVYGNDGVRSNWFKPEDIADIKQIIMKREKLPISATMVRDAIMLDNQDDLRKMVNPKILGYCPILAILMKARC